MKNSTRLLMSIFTLLISAAIYSPSNAEDKIVGIIWQVGTKGLDGKAKDIKWSGKIRATPDGKVWTFKSTELNRVIGTWNGDEEKTKMTVDGHEKPEARMANGIYECVLIGKDPKIWHGTFTPTLVPDLKVPFWLRMVQD